MTHWTHHQTILNGLRIHYVSQGRGPLVLLLHGFPEFWYSWRFQLPALAQAGFRAIAPDLRGYNQSEKPAGVAAYSINHLVEDVAAMLREWGDERGGFLVGHDWGGVIAWYVAHRYPDLVKKLTILNAPHVNRYLELLRTPGSQWLSSSYVAFFQLPWLPERLLTWNDGALIERMFRSSGAAPPHFTPDDARRYRRAIMEPGAARAMLNYYRSMARRTAAAFFQQPPLHIAMPTLLLWGQQDRALIPANADASRLARWVPQLQVKRVEASHWLQTERPEFVNQALLAFLQDDSAPPKITAEGTSDE